MRLRWQSFTDPDEHRPYLDLLRRQLAEAADPESSVEVLGMTPPDRELHRLSEFRCAAEVVRGALQAEADGCDAFLVGHFQDSGLHDARAAVDIPVLGLGETAMLHACTLGTKIGLVTIDPVFIPWHEEQISRYGLERRVIGVSAMRGADVAEYVRACAEDDAFERVVAEFHRAARPLLDAGAEVLIPAGGLPSLVLSRRPGLTIDGAAILNGTLVLAKHGEAAVKLRALGQPVVSRRSSFALPSRVCIDEFLDSLAAARHRDITG
jgi:Asp/Glu/hydantoin racemase